jgi:hypothetical protein
MLVEVLGFFSGAVVFGSAWMLYLRNEQHKAIRSAYGARAEGAEQRRNALIWPSR